MNQREVIQIINPRPSVDGDGVKIARILGAHRHDLDPFLMLDEIHSDKTDDYIGGFPPHPHRGIETLTYMINGGFVHEDHLGNKAELRDGGAQWMSTGHGIIHSELPLNQNGLLHGFQLWINLPAKEKLKKPDYGQAQQHELPIATLNNNVTVRAIAGSWPLAQQTLTSPLHTLACNARVAEINMPAEAQFNAEIPTHDTLLAFVFEGNLKNPASSEQQLLRFGSGSHVVLTAGDKGAKFLLLAGTPLNEPIVQYGPFVMNTQEEIEQAIYDYQTGKLTQFDLGESNEH
jgi:redox-sensitive bicupin YhaK (pirin superfamily)